MGFWNRGGYINSNYPVHYYSIPGTYRVRLFISSPGGCYDSAFINIVVNDTAGSRMTIRLWRVVTL
ncbi:MAG: hypothetical protein WDO71_02450 [Bacteroidota bacterium]